MKYPGLAQQMLFHCKRCIKLPLQSTLRIKKHKDVILGKSQ